MNTIGVVLLAAATATSGIGKPHAGGLGLFRAHVVQDGPPPPGGPINAAAMGVGGPAAGAGVAGNRRFPNTRSQLFFVDPPGMKITWQVSGANGERVYLPPQLTVPARYNFNQGYIYRLKITDIPGRKGLTLYPTVEIAPSVPATDAFLTHNPIPVQFTEEDFDQVTAGNFVTKVIYLPDPKYQELAIAGVETLVSTRLEPGVDPIREADRRGTILMILRVGMIDLEMPAGGTTTLAPGVVGAPTTVVPGTVGAPVVGAPGIVGAPTTVAPTPGVMAPASPDTPPFVPSAAEPRPVDVAPVTPVAPVPGVTEPAPPPPAPGVMAPIPAPSLPQPGQPVPTPGAAVPAPPAPGNVIPAPAMPQPPAAAPTPTAPAQPEIPNPAGPQAAARARMRGYAPRIDAPAVKPAAAAPSELSPLDLPGRP